MPEFPTSRYQMFPPVSVVRYTPCTTNDAVPVLCRLFSALKSKKKMCSWLLSHATTSSISRTAPVATSTIFVLVVTNTAHTEKIAIVRNHRNCGVQHTILVGASY